MNKFTTIIIPSYRSKKLILTHVKRLSKNFKIIIIENSYDINFKNIIENKYKNVDIYLKKNIGYGRAVNFASQKVKTKYFFVMNPDTKIYKNTLNNLINSAKKIDKFGAIGPIYFDQKKNYKKNSIIKKNKIIAAAMLIDTKTFKKIKGYDKNFFLYYEDNDYFRKCETLNLKLYQVTNSFIIHKKVKKMKKKELNLHSTTFSNINEKNNTYYIGGWHGQWSKFYFLKKYNGFIFALFICLPNILLNIIQMIPYIFFDMTKAKYKYYKIEGFACSVIGLPSFKRSKFDKKYILNI
ncbi:glycosyltransferase [Candidatus Pelagibacter sp.]|nr:glycosyltransferase [Candidatus Pelagibacter sp.]